MNRNVKRLFKWSLLGTLVLGGLASALDYRVDPVGGPDTLAARVESAVGIWMNVTDGVFEPREREDAENRIAYGDGTRFGPDTFSLTVQNGPDPSTDVRLNPTEPNEQALLHELGLFAGLNPSVNTVGVMNPAIPTEARTGLSPSDEESLRTLATFVPEDVNQDGVVDFYDLSDLGKAFGESGVSLPADIDENGVVNRADLGLLEAAYTFGAPSETPPEDALASASPGSDGSGGGAASGGADSGGAESGGAASGGAGGS